MSAFRKIGIAVIALVAAVAIVAVSAGVVLCTSPAGRIFLAEKAIVAVAGAQTAKVGEAGGAWPWRINLKNITVSDAEGPWLQVDRLSLTWHPMGLMSGHTNIDLIDIGSATIERWPAREAGAQSHPPNIDSLRRTFANLTVQRLTVGALIVQNRDEHHATTVTITGAVKPEADGRVLTLNVDRVDAPGKAGLRITMTGTRTVADLRGDISQISGNGSLSSDVGSDVISGTFHVACAGDAACYKWSDGVVGAAEADLTVGGSLSHPVYDADLRIHSLTLGTRHVETLTGKIGLVEADHGNKRITAEGTITGVAEAVRELAPVVNKQGTWSLRALWGDRLIVEEARAESGGTALQVTGSRHGDAFADVKATATVRGAARLFGIKQDQSLTTASLIFDRVSEASASGRIDIAVTEIAKENLISPIATGDIHLSARVGLDEKRLAATDIMGTWGALGVKGETAWATGHGFDHTKSLFNVTVAARRVAMLPQPVTAQLTLNGSLKALKVNVTGNAPEIAMAKDSALQAVVVKLDAARSGASWNGAVKTTAQSAETPLVLDLAFAKSADGELALNDLRLFGVGPLLRGAARIDVKTGLINGAFASKDAELVGLAKVFGVAVGLPGHAQINLTSRNGKQEVAVSVDATQVVANAVTADQVNADGTLADATGEGRLKASITLRDGTLFGRPLTSFAAKANGTFPHMALDVNAKGTPAKPLTLIAAANASFGAAATVVFTRLTLGNQRITGDLAAPARLTFSPAELTLAPFKMHIGGGSLDGQLHIDRRAATVTGNLTAAEIAVKVNEVEIAANAVMVLNGEVTVRGSSADAALDGALAAKFTTPDRASVDSHYTLKLKNGHAVFAGTATGLSKEDMRVAADIPAHLDMNAGRVTFDRTAPMAASIFWNGDVTTLWQLFAFDQHLLSGQVAVDVRARGTLDDPHLNGRVHLTQGRYENFVSLTAMRDLDLDMVATDGNAFTVALTATDGISGKISAKGKMTPATVGGWTVAVDADLDRFHLLRRDDVAGAATGKVSYAGSLATGAITGKLDLDRAEMVLGASYVPEVPLLRGRPGELLKSKKPAGFSAVRLDVVLNVADVVRVTGKGLESFWRGSLNAGGTIAAPDITGTLTLARGTFSFVGQQFQLDAGTVTFTGGGNAINPELNISASKQATDITANIAITGTARMPLIALTSTPSVPRDEVLARLLFRKDTTQLGPVESVQLASAAAELTGLQPGGINGLLRKPLGLDTVSVGGRTGKSLVLGRQITNSLYIGAEQSLSGSDREIVIERRLTPTLSLQSSTSDQTGSNIGIVWRKNY